MYVCVDVDIGTKGVCMYVDIQVYERRVGVCVCV